MIIVMYKSHKKFIIVIEVYRRERPLTWEDQERIYQAYKGEEGSLDRGIENANIFSGWIIFCKLIIQLRICIQRGQGDSLFLWHCYSVSVLTTKYL